jgi:prephenate dehydrogenase
MKSEADFAGFPETLSETHVAIWGLGLMGGSLAMALQGKTRWLAGIDPDEAVCQQARQLKVLDVVGNDAAKILPKADLIILAAPLGVIPNLLAQLPALMADRAVVLDLGSTKTGILAAMSELPERFGVLGGHPMCGKEVNTFSNASATLYRQASFALLGLERTPAVARSLAEQLVLAVGAHPVWMEAEEHDRWVAAISHLPYLAANALAAVTPVEAAALVGPGYLSTTRLASESEQMMMDILANNRANILPMLSAYRSQIEALEAALQNNDRAALQAQFHLGHERHEAVLEQHRKVIQA